MPTASKPNKFSKAPSKAEKLSKNEELPQSKSAIESGKPPKSDPALLDFFKGEIKDIFWAENHLLKALPKMQKAATSKVLAKAIGDHIVVTKNHVTRLEKVFELLGEKAQAKKCDAMEGISKEGESILEDTDEGTSTRDVGVILASQKAEHYEIATYGGLLKIATTLGLTEISDLLSKTLAEEKEADELLSTIAENEVNQAASAEA
jgi:ferritin-like metal-binding protein YciE